MMLKKGRVLLVMMGFIVCIMLSVESTYAYTMTQYSRQTMFKEGYLYFEIIGGPQGNSKIQLKVYRTQAPAWNTFNNSSTTWSVKINGGVNKHHIRLKSTSIQTKKDTTPEWNILNISLMYDMPAHYTYIKDSVSKAPPKSRLNLLYYNQANNGKNSAKETGYHQAKVSTRTINLQVNATQIGLRTYYNKRYYNVSQKMYIGLPQRKVTVSHYYQTAKDKKWHQFKTNDYTVTDTKSLMPYSTTPPIGYHVNSIYKVFQSGKVESTGKVNQQSAYICGGNKNIHIDYYANDYQNTISHWIGGFRNGEGNNGNKTMYLIGQSTFSSLYDVSWRLDENRQINIPKGFYLSSNIGTSHIDGYWKSYTLPLSVNQKSMNMFFEYYYYPYSYSITYHLDGGINHSANPTHYNVLYGVSLQTPYKQGYEFLGWYISGVKVTGINEGKNAYFSNKDILYKELSQRTIGNIDVYAKWRKMKPPLLTVPVNTYNNRVPFHDRICQSLILNKGDIFEAKRYASAYDEKDGDITDKIVIQKNTVPLSNKRAMTSGIYEVIYSVTNSYSQSTQKSLKVMINEPPVILQQERYFIKNSNLTFGQVLSQVGIVDQEEGILWKGYDIDESELEKFIGNKIHVHPYQIKMTIQNAKKQEIISTYQSENQKVSLGVGDYKVNIDVIDSHYGHSSQQFDLHIVEKQDISQTLIKSPRYIHLNSLSSLHQKGKWKNNQEYYHTLTNSLNRRNPMMKYHYSVECVKSVKKNSIPSRVSNIIFIQRYMRN